MANENNIAEVLLDTAIKSMEDHFKKLDGMAEKLKDTPELHGLLEELKKELVESRKLYQLILELNGKIVTFATHIDAGIKLLKAPVENKIVHHYPRLLWATAGLFLCLCIVCCGWLMTAEKLEAYKASDTKYRFLKLEGNKNLRQLLLETDSLLLADPQLRDSVIFHEEQQRQRLELLQQAKDRENEATEIKKKMRGI